MNKLLVGAVALGMLSSAGVLGTGVASGETALIVPGTAPSPYKPLRALYRFNPATQPEIGANYYNSAGATREVIPYPGSVWPITGVDSPTVGESVAVGTNNLDAAIRGTNGPIVVTGLSQGTLALDAEQRRLANDPSAPPPEQLTFIKAGDPGRLLGRMFKPGTHVPIIDYTVPAPVESQYDTIEIVGEYDIFSDPPDRPQNLVAVLNSIMAGGYYGHTATAFSDPARVPPQDVSVTTNSKGATTTTYFIRTEQLPMTRALQDMAGLSPEMAQRVDTALRPVVDAAYTRNDVAPQAPWRPALPVRIPAVSIPAPAITGPAVNVPTAAVSPVVTKGIANQLRGLLPKRKR
ncbi:PE-PPE domain-containing protein [Mycobacterium hubeiense]|uniref:PE-PPE domain-containing protein n=1 Tax=Mycobacterium hubeiense TaxID=1867256 RepID=UPI000C7ED1FC|nr:PE-PPE domain-containing protein [Mycobacterium sp. QGD 101]